MKKLITTLSILGIITLAALSLANAGPRGGFGGYHGYNMMGYGWHMNNTAPANATADRATGPYGPAYCYNNSRTGYMGPAMMNGYGYGPHRGWDRTE